MIHIRHSPIKSAVTALVAASFSIAAHAAGLSFDLAARHLTNTKGCPKASVKPIAKASVTQDHGKLYVVVAAAGEFESPLRDGPLATAPSPQQINALVGKRMCALADE